MGIRAASLEFHAAGSVAEFPAPRRGVGDSSIVAERTGPGGAKAFLCVIEKQALGPIDHPAVLEFVIADQIVDEARLGIVIKVTDQRITRINEVSVVRLILECRAPDGNVDHRRLQYLIPVGRRLCYAVWMSSVADWDANLADFDATVQSVVGIQPFPKTSEFDVRMALAGARAGQAVRRRPQLLLLGGAIVVGLLWWLWR